jgi:hypothetical protein
MASTSAAKASTRRENSPFQRAARGARGAGIGGGDEIGDSFGLGEVELAIEEGALAELAGPRTTRLEFDATLQQLLQHHRTAVDLQFDHVLTGVACGCAEVQGDAVVDGVAIVGPEAGVVCVSRLQAKTAHHLGDRACSRAGQAHDTDAAGAGRSSNGNDSVPASRTHGAIVADADGRVTHKHEARLAAGLALSSDEFTGFRRWP